MRAEDSITVIPGVGVKTAALYEKLGIVTVSDLLNNYPRAYEKYEEPITIREAAERDFAAVRVVPVSAPVVVRSSRVPFVTVTLTDREGGRMSAMWFRADWIRGAVRTGEEIVLRGRLSARGSRRVLTQPKIFSVEAYEQKTKTLQPVYTLTPGITAQAIAKHIRLVFDAGVTLPETLPDDLRARYGLMEKNEALRQIHFLRIRSNFLRIRSISVRVGDHPCRLPVYFLPLRLLRYRSAGIVRLMSQSPKGFRYCSGHPFCDDAFCKFFIA